MHLDADELNAYAEKRITRVDARQVHRTSSGLHAVPSDVGQLRFGCRRRGYEKRLRFTTCAVWIKAFLSSLFSPMVLRYAVPAVTLLALSFQSDHLFFVRRRIKWPAVVPKQQPRWRKTNRSHLLLRLERYSSNTNTKVATDQQVENKAEAQRGLADDSKSNRQNTEKPMTAIGSS
jgi:hypothetical protein